MSSVYVFCWIFLQIFNPIFAYKQTVWTLIRLLLYLGPHCLQKQLLKPQADDKADDNWTTAQSTHWGHAEWGQYT